ncbi:MAG TPA: prepilin-type N-terminal cleavage/methylation domain-containing protein [Longimicrobiales bacterium]
MSEANNSPGGFSLVEVVVAILVLSFGLLAMAASTGYVATQLKSATWDTQRNLARQQVIEQLKATVYANVTTNTTGQVIGPYTIRWNVTNVSAAQRRVQLITTGPAYRQSNRRTMTTIVDTATITIASP